MKKSILTTMVFLATLFYLADNTLATMYSITQITNNSINDSEPMINDSGQVIWVSGGSVYNDVFLYDSSTGATTNISNLGNNNRGLQINGQGQVVWINSTWDGGPAYNTSEVYLYDPNDVQQLKKITSDGYNLFPQINDFGQMVWQHGLYGTGSIFLYNIGAVTPGPTQLIASGNGPLINNLGQVLYRVTGSPGGIFLYNIADPATTLITSSGSNYQINNLGQVVWDTSYEIFLYDPSKDPPDRTQQITITETPTSRQDKEPQINDLGQVVYRHSFGTGEWDIRLYDQGTHTAIGGDFRAYAPQINNAGQVVWYEDRGGGNNEVFYYDPTTNNDVRMTKNSTNDGDAQINNSGQMVWVGFPDGNTMDSEIFFASPGPATTPSGSPVALDIVVTDTAGNETPLTITFDEVTTGGETTVTTTTSSPPLPAGFKVGDPPTYFEVETSPTLNFTGVEICFNYANTYYTDPNNIRLFHDDGAGGWEDITSSNDTTKRIVCGTTTHFSLFAILESSIACPSDPVSLGSDVSCSYSLYNTASITSDLWSWGDDSEDSPGTIISGYPTQIIGTYTYLEPGVYAVELNLNDGAWYDIFRYVVVYDPDGGFVTGGGWINSPVGAYALDPNLSGKATFGFVSKYQKGSPYPVGNTEFQFRAADFTFHSGDYDWLRVTGPKAIFKGTGTINGEGNYGFMLFAIDGALIGGGGPDKFRIKIWDKITGTAVYDNQMGESEDSESATAIVGGSIVIHN